MLSGALAKYYNSDKKEDIEKLLCERIQVIKQVVEGKSCYI